MRRRIVPSLRTQSQTAMTIGILVLVGLVGFLDCISGYELSFSLFYLGGSPEQLVRRSLTNPARQGYQEPHWSTYFGEMP